MWLQPWLLFLLTKGRQLVNWLDNNYSCERFSRRILNQVKKTVLKDHFRLNAVERLIHSIQKSSQDALGRQGSLGHMAPQCECGWPAEQQDCDKTRRESFSAEKGAPLAEPTQTAGAARASDDSIQGLIQLCPHELHLWRKWHAGTARDARLESKNRRARVGDVTSRALRRRGEEAPGDLTLERSHVKRCL